MSVRVRFLRELLDVLEREHGAAAVSGLPEKLPPRMRPHVAPDSLRSTGPSDTIPLADGEELLLAIDSALGDGSGKVLEGAMLELSTRTLSQSGGLLVSDLMGTVARLRTVLERPFADSELVFELKRSETGFSLTLGLLGRPRAARIMRHFAVGAIRAAQRFCREALDEELRIYGETLGDRAAVTAHYRQGLEPQVPEPMPFSRKPSRAMRAAQPSLADQVDRILHSRTPSGEFNSPLSTRIGRTQPPPPLRSEEDEED
jgi:hypothetical protein